MLIYDISFVDNNSEKHSIPFPIPNTNIEISYGTDGKRYLTLTYKYDNSDEKKEYLNKIQQLNSSLNSNFTISILNDDNSNSSFIFTTFKNLREEEIQDSVNKDYIYRAIDDSPKFELRLFCQLGENI